MFAVPARRNFGDTLADTAKTGLNTFAQRSDQLALQNAIGRLAPDAAPQEVLKTIMGTQTYGNEAKEQAFGNYLKTSAMQQKTASESQKVATYNDRNEALKRKNEIEKDKIASRERVEADKLSAKKEANEAKEIKEREDVKATYRQTHPDATEEEVEKATKGITPSSQRAITVKPENVTDYNIAQNHAKRIEPTIKNIQERAKKAKPLITPTETAILNNERYTTGEKYWDAALDLADNTFLNLLKSNTGQQLASYTPIAVSSFSDKMGGVLSVRKINLIEKKAVSPGKDKDTNRLFLYMDLYDRKLDELSAHFTDEIIASNKYGLPPADFNKQLDEKLYPYRKMIDEDIGQLLNGKKPSSQLSELGIVNSRKKNTPPGQVYVISPEGKEGYLDLNLVGTPGYEGFKRL